MNKHNIRPSNQQQRALAILLEYLGNLVIQGKAGTGKTYIIKQLAEACKSAGINLICLATTGFAAQNLPGGMTLHSFFKLPLGFFDRDNYALSDQQAAVLSKVDIILIDECSMIRADYFEGIDWILKQANNSNEPFGGKKIVLVGDIFQLPPVFDSPLLHTYLQFEHGGIYFFNTQAFLQGDFSSLILTQVFRQTDSDFIDLLDAIRFNTPEIMNAINRCNQRVKTQNDPNVYSTCCTRHDAADINAEALDRLPGPMIEVEGRVTGYFPKYDLPTEQCLKLKIGARVTLLANKTQGDCFLYTNGTVGTIIDYYSDRSELVLLLDSGEEVKIGEYLWTNFEYHLVDDICEDCRLIQEEIGSFKQFPVQLAYASTIHKSQGKTLDRMKLVLGGKGCFAYGQLYTGLSRVRKLEDLTLDRPLRLYDALTDPQVLSFYQQLEGLNMLAK